MSKSVSPPSAANLPTSGDTNSAFSLNNTIPRSQFSPGQGGPVRNPHPHDVLSGRGGRINSHPGNVCFRDIIDAYKRQYLDPRTKKTEKARIAACIVSSIRVKEPTGRFLKEDPHTGLWVEIGDERAWKKAGQALRESAPEIRAERQMKLQMMAGVGDSNGVVADAGLGAGHPAAGGSVSGATRNGGVSKGGSGRKSRQADPPGPRHRPNPPKREGLAAVKRSKSRVSAAAGSNYNANEADVAVPQKQKQQQQHGRLSNATNASRQAAFDEDAELTRMRKEYFQMQKMQQEQQRKMEQYQEQLLQRGQVGAVIGGGSANAQAVYDEYHQMQKAELMGDYRQQIHRKAQSQLDRNDTTQQQMQRGQRYSNHQDITAQIMDDGLLPLNAGFDIPALRGEHPQQQYQQQINQGQDQQFSQNYNQDFNNRHFNACDKTVSTVSSFDAQSMDMSSLGGFSWNQSAYNMSGLISTGDTTQGSQRYNPSVNNASGNMGNASGRGAGSGRGASSGSMKSRLERKLDKVNEQHRRQQMQEMQHKQQDQQGMGYQGVAVQVPTAGGMAHQQQQQQMSAGNPRSRKYQESNNMMSSINSFGFEAIEEDEIGNDHSELKSSNFRFSGMSEMDMTFGSDLLSVRSKTVPKMSMSDEKKKQSAEYHRASTAESLQERTDSDGNVEGVAGNAGGPGLTASGILNQSISSNSASGSSARSYKSSMSTKTTINPLNMSMEDFDESFKSMEMEDQQKQGSPQYKKPLDPDGAVGDVQQRYASSGMGQSQGRRKDHGGGRLSTIHSSRGLSSVSATSATASTNNHTDVQLSSTVHNASNANCNNRRRRTSIESMGISDPDMMKNFGASNKTDDFGVSLESLRSFQSHDTNASNASSWVNQYNSMGAGSGSNDNLWDDEEQQEGASDRSSMSEISAPRMVTASGGS